MAGAFLDELDASTLSRLREISTRRTWPTGATLFHEGDRADRVIVLESGTVKAVSVSETGTEVVHGLRGPGEVVGEMAVVDAGTRSASVVALDAVEALVIETTTFEQFLRTHADAAFSLLAVMAGRLRGASRRQAEFGSLETSERLARILVELATEHGRRVEAGIEVKLLSQDELASVCAASREAVARALRALREAQLVETGRRSVTVLDVDGLRAWTAS